MAEPCLLQLTDRTRYKIGTGRCGCARYLGYHFGPTGYGIAPTADSLPLATGLYVHAGIEAFGRLLKREDRLPTLHETREIVADVRRGYEHQVTARGFEGILSSAHTAETIQEQSCLISGLLWALRLKLLPWLHQTYTVLSVEEERLHLLSCTCGAGPLDASEHIARGCQGVALMLRTDILAQRRGGTTLAYFEAKTTGWESSAWAEQWETDPQLGLGTLDVDRLYGTEVSELYIVGLNKGPRRRDKDEPDGRRKQISALCYGYKRPGNPPLFSDEWLPAYEWTDEATGEVKRASRAHRRTGVWDIPKGDWTTWLAYKADDPSLTAEEVWVRLLPASVLDKVCFLLGPMNRQDQQIQSVRTSMAAEEQRWQEILWELYEVQHGGVPLPCDCDEPTSLLPHTPTCASHRLTEPYAWPTPEFQTRLDQLVPKSWNCRPFGKDHQCSFVPICHRYAGWDDPLATGRYQARRPHHAEETLQAIARGLLPEETAAVEED